MRIGLCLGLAALAALASPLAAQQTPSYPTRTVTLVVPAAAGGPTDLVARLLGEQLQRALSQPFIVSNRAGASQTIGTAAVAIAEPDGYNLLFTTNTPIVLVPLTMRDVPYNVRRDFVTVAHVATTPLVLYVNSETPVRNVRELVEYVRTHQDAANFGSYGNASIGHLLMEVLMQQTRMTMQHVPYRSIAPQLQALAGAEILTAVADIGSATPLVSGGRIRPIAVTGARRSSVLPDVPTFGEQGITDLEAFSAWLAMFAPANTPQPIVDRLSTEIVRIATSDDFRNRLRVLGFDPTGMRADEANRSIASDLDVWERTIRNLSHVNFAQ